VFTGIVEEVGRVLEVSPLGNGRAIRIAASEILPGLRLGDSIAVDGVCLTVTALRDDGFEMESVATTLERTTVGDFAPGRRVNLERALSLGARLGGHLVQGHVDGVGEVVAVRPLEELVLIDFTLPAEVAPATVLHGSIALNGISLTVNDLPSDGVAQVSIIPFTLEHTAIGDLRAGDRVNLEGDLIGKYVRRLLGVPAPAGADRTDLLRSWGYQGSEK
jgi:riboflavin synthase